MIFMIATIRKDKHTIIGIRLLDTNTEKILDVSYENVLNALKHNKITIENLRVEDNKLKGYNGSIERYPILNQNLQPTSQYSIIILGKTYRNLMYCADYTGIIGERKLEDQPNFGEDWYIANGKVVNGHLSAIEGTYKNINFLGDLDDKVREYFAKCSLLDVKPAKIEITNGEVIFHGYGHGYNNTAIPNFVTTIGESAFQYKQITEIEIPSSVVKISDNAFATCKKLKTIKFNEGLKTIGNRAFSECESIESIILPNTLESVGEQAFRKCSNLKEFIFKSNKADILGNAFGHCINLQKIEMPKESNRLGNSVFEYCNTLTNLKIPYGIEVIGNSAFENSGINSIELPETIKIISDEAFANSKLQNVHLPKSVIFIGSMAFENCKRLKNVEICNNNVIIGDAAFRNCDKINSIKFSSKTIAKDSKEGKRLMIDI